MKEYFKLVIIILLVLVIGGILMMRTSSLRGNNNIRWEEELGKWYEWKIKTKLPKHQREIIDYFQEVDEVMTKAKNTWWVNKDLQNPPPEEGINIVDTSIAELNRIEPPEECVKYHKANLKWLEIIEEYHEKRLETDDPDELGKISLKTSNVDGFVFTEFFRILKDSGFMDNYEEEASKLKTK